MQSAMCSVKCEMCRVCNLLSLTSKLVPAARLAGPVGGALHAADSVGGALHASGPVRGALQASGPVRGALQASGPVRGALHAAGPFSPAPPAQARARGEGLASLFLSLSHCLSGSLSIQLDQSPDLRRDPVKSEFTLCQSFG